MTLAPPPSYAFTSDSLLIRALRCWREARDANRPVQPYLARTLMLYDCAILAPVLDSLMRFYEVALGRPISTGRTMSLSKDEHVLLDLVSGDSQCRNRLTCTKSVAAGLDCALCSTRVMMALSLSGEKLMQAGTA